MYTIQQATENKIVIPYNGTDYDFLLIVFTYSCYESVGIFENVAGTGCDYEIVVNEVGSNGTSDPENGDVKISPRSTWKGEVYGQGNNVNLFPQYAAFIEDYKFQVKGDSCNVYPNLSPQIDCLPATAIVQDQDGNELARENIASGATGIIPVNTGSGVLYTYPYDSFNTGQDVSYATGDDKYIRDTVFAPEIASWDNSLAWSFPVLDPTDTTKLLRGSNHDGSGNNIFGNLERFTDTVGTQIYANNIAIDHLTGEMFITDVNIISNSVNSFSAYLNYVNNLSFAGYNDWHGGNVKEYLNLVRTYVAQGLNYSPINYIGDPIISGADIRNLRMSTSASVSESYCSLINFRDSYGLVTRDNGETKRAGLLFRKAFTYNPTTKQMDLT